MPKHNLFPPLSILAYMTRVVIRYKPGKRKTEVCRQLVKTLEEKATKKKFPSLSYACDILKYCFVIPSCVLLLSFKVILVWEYLSELLRLLYSSCHPSLCL
eukprot:GHVQ01023242.1.p1 GENE.GHVQ01023242.1~~GHVQ01023242.1.p1  ORF type:complete len:101 (-),score=5.34 GHVQ01023242.1:1494-1796(-)